MTESEDFTDMLNSIDIENSVASNDPQDPDRPQPFSTEWTEYILDQLSDSELREGSPIVAGLRRVTEQCYGEIVKSLTDIIEPPNRQNPRCTLRHRLYIRKYSTGSVVEVDGCVDVEKDKLDYPFNRHMVSTADTKAEGKALRRALKINVITSEEIRGQSDEFNIDSDDKINDQQILAINQMCKRMNVDVPKMVKSIHSKVKVINEVSNVEARLLINKLSEYQRSMDEIPKTIQGYKDAWKIKFYKGV